MVRRVGLAVCCNRVLDAIAKHRSTRASGAPHLTAFRILAVFRKPA